MITNDQIKANRDKWVEALRSGEYKQGRSRLKNPYGKYCCLGVACEVMKLPHKVGKCGRELYGVEEEYLNAPIEIIEGMGLYGVSAPAALGHLDNCLTVLNDFGKYTFDQIADILEEGNHWKPLD